MPIYMDVHIVPGVQARSVAEAHTKDLLHQEEHHCKCMTYWVDEKRESIFCLIEAPDKESVIELHNEAHGLIPSKIIEVDSSLVESFLGRIYDPKDAVTTSDGLKVFAEPSFRTLLLVESEDPVLMEYQHGKEKAIEFVNRFNSIVRGNSAACEGREAEHSGTNFIISFASAKNAVSCALAIQSAMLNEGDLMPGFKMSLNAGEPIAQKDSLFGDTIQLARYMCAVAKGGYLVVASSVKDLVAKENLLQKNKNVIPLTPQDEKVLELLFTKLEEKWQEPEFDMTEYGQSTTMSKSQLYRKTISLTGVSPNILLKDFRLEKARALMKKQQYSIAQITFETGFSSPSYFTKCFKKKFGLLPNAYLDILY